ncbi:hypothetical protein J4E80_007211 [Alternaria sp. BMP 0032]|nr:hypothetical protein J4E80_007211 [Alternaria sp. BMP 0032]
MIALGYFWLAYGCLMARTAMIPRAPTTSTIAKPEPILASEPTTFTASPAGLAPRQNSNGDEEAALHALEAATFAAQKDRYPGDIYNEYTYSTCLGNCADDHASDPTPISIQSAIGNTTLTEVRFFQCNVAYRSCHEDCLKDHKKLMGEWPPVNNRHTPVMTSNTLRNCMTTANAVAQMDRGFVSKSAGMTKEEFERFNTVGMCNIPLFDDTMICQGKFQRERQLWDLEHSV